MDIPRPDNFNETYLYEGMLNQIHMRIKCRSESDHMLILGMNPQSSWSAIWLPLSAPASL